MTNALAIAAVTRTLRRLLAAGVSGDFPTLPDDVRPAAEIRITTLPPDRARDGDATDNQINLFLYQTTSNGAWTNMDLPGQTRPGEAGLPPLPLNLHYLITAYGQGNSELVAHLLLGQALRVLHDHSILGRAELRDSLEESELHDQVERVRITAQPLSLEEISRLWSGFQTPYRLSAAYEVSVVLIESRRPAVTPLPVLTRGDQDRGIPAQANLTPPFPTLTGVEVPNDQPGARLGDRIRLTGHHLGEAGSVVSVRLVHNRLGTVLTLAPTAALPRSSSAIALDIPAAPAGWPAGTYTVTANIQEVGRSGRETNELALPLLPRITSPLPVNVGRDGDGVATITLDCEPHVRPGQRAALLLGGHEVPAEPFQAVTGTLTFVARAAAPGPHWVRLRVDGVDSLLVNRSTTPPSFDPTQRVTIT